MSGRGQGVRTWENNKGRGEKEQDAGVVRGQEAENE